MEPDRKLVSIRMDMRGPSRATDCFDVVVAFPLAVERIRAANDDAVFPQTMIAGTRVAFAALQREDQEGLLFVAAAAQDLLYRYIMQLTVMDRYTRAYCALAVRYFFEQLTERGIRTFYILDNFLREDRLTALLELFELSGITTTTPGRDGPAWPTLATKLRAGLDTVGHAAYIEPDATVNHLDAVRQLANGVYCVATFRNLHPDDPQHEIINFQGRKDSV